MKAPAFNRPRTEQTQAAVLRCIGVFVIASLTAASAAAQSSPAPVAAYAYNEGTGPVTVDASPSNNTATLQGATWTTVGKFGKALSFNGTTAFVESPDINAITPGARATFEAWVYLNAAPPEVASVFNKWTQTVDDEYFFGINPDRTLAFYWQTTGGYVWGTPSFNAANGVGAVPVGAWTHIAVVRTRATLRFYINGTLDTSVTVMDTKPFRNGSAPLRVGGQGRGGRDRYFNGTIDEVRLYTRALTRAEIRRDMNTSIVALDTTPPTVSISAPASGSTVSGTAVSVAATATDTGGVAGVQFKLDGANLGAEDTTAPYSIAWDTTLSSNGPHTLTAVARDTAGNTGTSAAVTVTVSNLIGTTPVAAYAYDEGTGPVTADASPSNNTATLQGATWTTVGKFGKALSFNGATAFVESPDINAITPGVTATFEAWVYLNAAPPELASVFNKWTQTVDDEYLFGINPDRTLTFSWQTTGGYVWGTPSFNAANGVGAVPVGAWTHIAAVRAGATLRFYINGTLDTSVTVMDTNPFRNGSAPLRVGGQGRGGMDRYFNGTIDEVRLYTRALTPAEIQRDMTTPITTSSSGAQVTLSWDPNAEPDLAGYKLYYGTSSGSYQSSVDVGNHTSYTLSGLQGGQIYYFAVTAYDVSRNESGFSNEVSATVTADVTSPTRRRLPPAPTR